MNRFDEIVTGSIDIAYAEALHRKNTEVAAVHLLYGLIANPATSCHRQYQGIKSKLISWMDDLPSAQKPVGMDALRPASDFSRWITLASADTVKAGRDEVTPLSSLSLGPWWKEKSQPWIKNLSASSAKIIPTRKAPPHQGRSLSGAKNRWKRIVKR